MTFQPGDLVECIDSYGLILQPNISYIELGGVYTVSHSYGDTIVLEELPHHSGGYYSYRFKLVKPAASSNEYEELFL